MKAIQKCDFILCFRQELRESVYAFVKEFSKTVQLRLGEIAVKRLKEARVARGDTFAFLLCLATYPAYIHNSNTSSCSFALDVLLNHK